MGSNIVLCVDDEEVILNSLEMELSENAEDYQVELAQGGVEALELVAELVDEGHQLAVVVSDYIMPEMKGDELLININEKYPTTVNILLTGQSHIDGVTNAINHANLHRYIEKPWEKADLQLTVNQAVKRFNVDQRLAEQEKIIKDMNEKLLGQDSYNVEEHLSDEALYDQIYFSRFYQSLNIEEKHWFALASIGMICIDGQVSKTEMNYINSIVRDDRRKEVVEEYVEMIRDRVRPNLESIELDLQQSLRILRYLSHILVSKKKIKEEEENYFYYIGKKLGLDTQAVGDSMKIAKHRIVGNFMEYKLSRYVDEPH
jgi:YesN/AraC family two-component response regulator